MKKCNKCRVIIENDLMFCPLCHYKVENSEGRCENDFTFGHSKHNDFESKIRKILMFIFIFLVGLNITLNIILAISLLWAPYFILVLLYAYLMMIRAMKSNRNIGITVVLNVYILSTIMLVLDIMNGFQKWSINYVIPLMIMAGIIALTIFLTIKRSDFIDYIIYMFSIAFFGLILLPFLVFGLISVLLPTIITSFVSFVALFGIFVFGNRESRNEFKKRFHM